MNKLFAVLASLALIGASLYLLNSKKTNLEVSNAFEDESNVNLVPWNFTSCGSGAISVIIIIY
jgi:hypothetical protein